MFDRSEIASACRAWGPRVAAPAGVDGVRLLWALAGCESSFGADCRPRHEPYFHDQARLGKNAALVALTRLYGCDAHSSFGPWQLLLLNCSQQMAPEMFGDVHRACGETVRFINQRIVKARQAATVEQIAAAYNSGKWDWVPMPVGVQRYMDRCRGYYDHEPMPA